MEDAVTLCNLIKANTKSHDRKTKTKTSSILVFTPQNRELYVAVFVNKVNDIFFSLTCRKGELFLFLIYLVLV